MILIFESILFRYNLFISISLINKLTFYYSDAGEQQDEDLQQQQHLPVHARIKNPNAIKGNPKTLKQPQHVEHVEPLQLAKIAVLTKNVPPMKQTKSHKT